MRAFSAHTVQMQVAGFLRPGQIYQNAPLVKPPPPLPRYTVVFVFLCIMLSLKLTAPFPIEYA